MAFETVLYERDGAIGILRLNRPERMNAVIEQMYLDIQAVLAEARIYFPGPRDHPNDL